MIKWMMGRIADILLALMVLSVLVWFVLTQPIFTLGGSDDPLPIDRQALDQGLRGLMAIPQANGDAQARFAATSEYLVGMLSTAGEVDQSDRSEGQRMLHVRVGKGAGKRLYVILHVVVADRPVLEIAETAFSLAAVAKAVSVDESVGTQLDLTVFLHHADRLEQSLLEVGAYHVDKLVQAGVEDVDDLLVFMPGLYVPDLAYKTDQWDYFHVLYPSDRSDLALFGRLRDVGRVRNLKYALRAAGFGSVGSLSIPVSFPDMPPSLLKFYWDQDLPAVLVKPGILVNDQDFSGHARFISAFYRLLKKSSE